jgi:hypothetical protein
MKATISAATSGREARDTRFCLQLFVAFCATGLLGIGIGACGAGKSSSPASRTTSVTEANAQEHIQKHMPFDSDRDTDLANPDEDDDGKPAPPDRDNDGDSNGHGRYDSDDYALLNSGHPANASDKAQITALVQSYYAAVVAEDGAKGCALLYSPFAEAVPEDYGTVPPGPAYARGTTCPAVMTLVYKHFHNEVATRFPKLHVARVRLKEAQGFAVLSFGALSEREIHVAREGHAWKIVALLDNQLP